MSTSKSPVFAQNTGALRGAACLDGERMEAAGEFLSQAGIDLAMTFHPAQSVEAVRPYANPEMRFTAFAPAAMPAMLFAFVENFQFCRRKCQQGFFDALLPAHNLPRVNFSQVQNIVLPCHGVRN
jgi:hypothetical protein